MGLNICESFDVGSVDEAAYKWDHFDFGIHEDYGRHGRGARIEEGTGDPSGVLKLPTPTREFVWGFWINFYNLGGSAAHSTIAKIGVESQDSDLVGGSDPQDGLAFRVSRASSRDEENNLRVYVISGGSSQGHLSFWVDAGKWQYVEFRYSYTDGTLVGRVDSVEVDSVSFTAPDKDFDYYAIQEMASLDARFHYLDDLSFINMDSTSPNDWLGPTRIDVIRPDGQGAHDDFLPSDSEEEKADILAGSVDMDDYVAGSSVGDEDTYSFEQIPGPFAVHALQLSALVARGDSDPWTLAPVIRRDGTDETLESRDLESSEQVELWPIDQDPHTSDRWGIGDLHDSEIGFEAGQSS